MKRDCGRHGRSAGALRTARNLACAATAAIALAIGRPAVAIAQGGLPSTTIAPDDESASPVPPGAPAAGGETGAEEGGEPAAPPAAAPSPSAHRRRHVVKHHVVHPVHHSEPTAHSVVEPASAKLRLKEDAWAYSRPSKSSKSVERVHAGKFLDVTGITRYYLQVRLKSGTTAYVPIAAVDLTKPTDKMFQLHSDATVLSEPSHYGQKLSEVHRGHDVHVVATSLNYLKIRMKSGLEGFIPMSAVE
ncbi:MAG TPA: hypothetical protein VJ718_08110 [Candidatus Binataceae bacterium]|nr:hypothetical protein [Candidatus Binataceae bacterium]